MYGVFTYIYHQKYLNVGTLPETKIAPENGWLEYGFPFGARPIFRGELLVLGSVSRSAPLSGWDWERYLLPPSGLLGGSSQIVSG